MFNERRNSIEFRENKRDIDRLVSQVDSLSDDIHDFIDETPPQEISSSIEDLDKAIARIEDLRSAFRTKQKELQTQCWEHQKDSVQKSGEYVLNRIKTYITEAKARRKSIRDEEGAHKVNMLVKKSNKVTFINEEVRRIITDLNKVFICEIDDDTDEQITKRKEELSDQLKLFQTIPKKIEEMMDGGEFEKEINEIKVKYENLHSHKDLYTTRLNDELVTREIEKKKNFSNSTLNIKLHKFKGYDSTLDIYTFQDKFEKLHKSSPKSLYPDILKNNYLEGSALSLVKGVTDMKEIWERLKDAYGDTKIMLAKKINELSNIECISKIKDTSKVIDALSSIINLMKDLLQLSKRHKIENHLFYGDGFDRIYRMMGESRLNRWLNKRDDLSAGEELWLALILFLEKDLKVSQQKASIFQKSADVKSKENSRGSHYTDEQRSYQISDQGNGRCFICGEMGHVQTPGPNGIKLVQYFVCNKFASMSPAERYRVLREKGFCHQCLLPGAEKGEEKHKEGRCQRDFTCQHATHERHTMKKHVLVCEEHKDTNENKELLQNYKRRCILRRGLPDLPGHAREIQLSHYVRAYAMGQQNTEPPIPEEPPEVEIPAIEEIPATEAPSSEQPDIESNPIEQPSNEQPPLEPLVSPTPESPISNVMTGTTSESVTEAPLEVATVPTEVEVNVDSSGSYPSTPNANFDRKEIENAIYMLQTIKVDDSCYNIFYDNGCGNSCFRHQAVQRLGSRAIVKRAGPSTIKGVSDIETTSPYGEYNVTLPLASGEAITLSGICLDKVTETFPLYPLQGRIEEDIRRAFKDAGGNLLYLPCLPAYVGGDTDIMIGIKYLRWFPVQVFQMFSGLTIYHSKFQNADGSYGIIGGNHEVITMIETQYHVDVTTFITRQRQLYTFGYQINPDVSILGLKVKEIDAFDDEDNEVGIDSSNSYYAPQGWKNFQKVEEAGTIIDYRCPVCRKCKECKNPEHHRAISMKEEVEQSIIDASVEVDFDAHVTTASLPLIADPVTRLTPNRNKAFQVYKKVLRDLDKNPGDRESALKCERKLHDLGFVAWVRDLPEEVQKMLKESPIQNFFPWFLSYKESSVSTAVRPVFHATMPTASGYSLNDIVAKGKNNMNALLEIFIRWRMYRYAFHTDIRTMYNCIQLKKEFWCFQRYLFQKDLDPLQEPEEKIIKTCIYGVRSSGNQAERGLRLTAEMNKDEYPEVYDIVRKDIYVDDCLSGEQTPQLVNQRADQLETVLNTGGFTLKGITITGETPHESLTMDGITIAVMGHKWDSKEDIILFDIKPLNFVKKKQGRKVGVISDVPKNLSKRHCSSKVGEVFDLAGLCAPVTGTFKIDLHTLTVRKLKWDDTIPDELRALWISHFDMIAELKNLRYHRAVIPEDAVNVNAELLDFGDASKVLICAAIYVRFKRKNGEHSCQLLLGKTKIVPEGMSQPRAELYAALVNTHSGEIVRRSLGKFHQNSTKFTDSQIALHWICNEELTLKEWPRNRVIDIQRFTEPSMWWYVKSKDMIADIGTRRCTSIEVIKPNSIWINGLDWMKKDISEFPMMSASDIRLSCQEKSLVQSEVLNIQPIFKEMSHHSGRDKIYEKVLDRYEHSDYIIDPNRWKFTTVIRIFATWLRYMSNLKCAAAERKKDSEYKIKEFSGKPGIIIKDEEIKKAQLYYSKKSTAEVKKFLKPPQYINISKEINGLLLYSERILPINDVTIVGKATQVMKDLTSTSFCVPLTDKHSPIAFSLVNDVHWNHPTARHCGVETVLRYVTQTMYIVEGRTLVRMIGQSCERCRYLNKKALDAAMGPVSLHSLTIAPAFYVSQVDLAGPFDAHCHHHKRNTIKIWYVVFCCATTSTTIIKVMEDYSTTSFLHAFTRFSSDVGYPKTLLIDSGSQLIKGCETMKLSFWDIKFQLSKDVNVDFEICPVGGHNINGKVERKIREVKKSINKSLSNRRLSIMQWETLGATISNSINNMPLALGNIKSTIESLDLLTPNRLRLGRNNERSPEGPVRVEGDLDKTIADNEAIFQSWFEVWLTAHVPTLMNQSKWFTSDKELKKGDVVLFLKQESSLASNYQFGIVESAEVGHDGKVRKVKVKYRNHNESVDRFTSRAIRSLVVIRRYDESNVMEELNELSRYVESRRSSKHQ